MTTNLNSYKVDRTGWPSGPWDDEPDRLEWVDESTGLSCLMLRHPDTGHWCGYVAVPESHSLYGKDYNEAHEAEVFDIRVHGGLTFAGADRGAIRRDSEIEELEAVWWFGFDCAHAWDFSPGRETLLKRAGVAWTPSSDLEYRDQRYTWRECTRLASQLGKERPL